MDTRCRTSRTWSCVGAGFTLAVLCTGPVRSAPIAEAAPGILKLDVDGVTFELVRIPAGTFLLGSNDGDSDERPVHEVSVAGDFYMGRTEVTTRQFRAFVASTGYQTVAERQGAAWHMPAPDNSKWIRGCNWRSPPFEQKDDYPVVCLSYLDAVAFCAWLSSRSGQSIGLPTEAQWEYACRADANGAGTIQPEAVAWSGDDRVGLRFDTRLPKLCGRPTRAFASFDPTGPPHHAPRCRAGAR